MLLERSFRVRGKEIHLRELTNLVALLLSGTRVRREADRVRTSSLSRLKSEVLDDLATTASLLEVRAFEDDGWVFVPKDEVVDLPSKVPKAKVFIKPDGRLALSLNRLVVKLHDGPQGVDASKALERFGVRILESFTFSARLFRVEVTNERMGDAIEVANKLHAAGICEFAEPELLEVVAGR